MIGKTKRGSAVLLTWLVSLASPAAADPSPPDETSGSACNRPSSENTDEAKGAFRQGQQAFNRGDYEVAAQHWTRAYSSDCTAHALLLNLAMAQELRGEPEKAIHALRLFNKRAPESSYAGPNLSRIRRLEQALREKNRPVAPPKPCPKPIAAPAPPAPAPPRPDDESLADSLPLGIAAAGTAITLAGGLLYLEARSDLGDVEERCGGRGSCTEASLVVRGERARARADVAGWLLGAGLGLVTGGVAWHLLARDDSAHESAGGDAARWSAELGPDRAAVSVSGRF